MSPITSLADRRAAAVDTFRTVTLPHRRTKDWKYSDISRVTTADMLSGLGAARWEIENLPAEAELIDLLQVDLPDWVNHHLGALGTDNPLALASLGYAKAGFALRIPARVQAGTIRIRISGGGTLRTLVLAEQAASVNLVEIAENVEGLRNTGMELMLCPGAHVVHSRLSAQSAGVSYAGINVMLLSGARYQAHFASFGAKLSRVDLHAVLAEADAQVDISGVAALGSGDHADMTTHIEHKAAGKSTQLFKYVAGGKSRAVYQGRITVHKGADGTDSRQTARAILLSDKAEADLKPELLIFADDVKCAHGAAVGDFDPDALFYLQSRGLSQDEARDMLIRAFLGEAVDIVSSDVVRDEVWQMVEAGLARATSAGKEGAV